MGNDSLTVKTGKRDVEAMRSITLKCGPSEIKLTPTGITISGVKVDIEGKKMSVSGLMTEVAAKGILKLGGRLTKIG